jgi:hypothetical protein
MNDTPARTDSPGFLKQIHGETYRPTLCQASVPWVQVDLEALAASPAEELQRIMQGVQDGIDVTLADAIRQGLTVLSFRAWPLYRDDTGNHALRMTFMAEARQIPADES